MHKKNTFKEEDGEADNMLQSLKAKKLPLKDLAVSFRRVFWRRHLFFYSKIKK